MSHIQSIKDLEREAEILRASVPCTQKEARHTFAINHGFRDWDAIVLAHRCQWSCGSCGELFDSELELEEHDFRKCWDETHACPACGMKHGFDWDSDPLYKMCKGCRHKVDNQ